MWTAQCQQAFSKLTDALTSVDDLALPNEGRFILDCDASDYEIGAVLSQIQNDVDRPVCYASRLFNKHEQNYDVTGKELLAVVTFTKRFKQYLLGRSFTIRTDHAALQWLKKTPEPMGQQARWLEVLEEFSDYKVERRAGTQHGNADALSRRPPEPFEIVTIALHWSLTLSGIVVGAIVQDRVKVSLPYRTLHVNLSHLSIWWKGKKLMSIFVLSVDF